MKLSAKRLQNNTNLAVGAPTSGQSWIRHCLLSFWVEDTPISYYFISILWYIYTFGQEATFFDLESKLFSLCSLLLMFLIPGRVKTYAWNSICWTHQGPSREILSMAVSFSQFLSWKSQKVKYVPNRDLSEVDGRYNPLIFYCPSRLKFKDGKCDR